jgi:hypothetical protein
VHVPLLCLTKLALILPSPALHWPESQRANGGRDLGIGADEGACLARAAAHHSHCDNEMHQRMRATFVPTGAVAFHPPTQGRCWARDGQGERRGGRGEERRRGRGERGEMREGRERRGEREEREEGGERRDERAESR